MSLLWFASRWSFGGATGLYVMSRVGGVLMPTKAETLTTICQALDTNRADAEEVVVREYPALRVSASKRNYSKAQSFRVFVRDGFIDRYTGDKLVFPGVLRLLSLMMPTKFPFHPNWKVSETHPAYWELFPTVDHVIPVARGGLDEEANFVTTSMLHNSAKAHWTLGELGWSLHDKGNFHDWDGLLGWFRRQINRDPSWLKNPYLKQWSDASKEIE
jgi:hypothetical protein